MKIPDELDQLRQFPEASIAVCAFDAGSASHLVSWLQPLQKQLRLYLSGPAKSLFRASWGLSVCSYSSLEETLKDASLLISGTGWESDLEHRARLAANAVGIPTVAVLDHWCNYRQRFLRNGYELLPDVLWVADEEAATIAKAEFPSVSVVRLPNHWLNSLCEEVTTIRSRLNGSQQFQPRRPARTLLYLLEPIRVPWISGSDSASYENGEFQALRYWLQQLPQLIDKGWVAMPDELETLTLRPHPSEPIGKYDAFIAEVRHLWPICLDTSDTLAESLAWADAAFGCETQALVAAMACDLLSISTVPPWAPPCCLIQPSLHHLRDLT